MGIFSKKAETAEVFDAATTALNDIAGDYTLDPAHSHLGFSARHAMVTTVHGAFNTFEGSAHIDTFNPALSTVSVKIDVTSVDTGDVARDGHLLSDDFLSAKEDPYITFESTAISCDGTAWEITGDLTIKGVSHPLTVPFELTGSAKDPYGNMRVGFEGATSINRSDWGLTFNAALETGGVLLSDLIKLDVDISAIRKA
ncbi:MAG: YceI family protein [Acidimicrobiia bacterium]